jgi:hypothetical protein
MQVIFDNLIQIQIKNCIQDLVKVLLDKATCQQLVRKHINQLNKFIIKQLKLKDKSIWQTVKIALMVIIIIIMNPNSHQNNF